MKNNYIYCVTAVIIAVILASSYLYSKRFSISTTEKIAYVYDTFTDKIRIFTLSDKEKKPDESPAEQEQRQLSKKVELSAEYAPLTCSESHPVYVKIINSSDRKILYTKFSLDVRIRGKSSTLIVNEDINYLFGKQYHLDDIIEPGYTMTACFAMPKLSQEYDESEMEIFPFHEEYTFWGVHAGSIDTLIRFDAL